MPLGFERLNERTQRPNALINFIRPLPGPTSTIAEQILSRVAAVCYPFMKAHTILVQALEEFPHNNEFVGRNFNAGEVIQLVLRDRSGRWLPQRMVEMVMVHELAHCKQMNHSKAFWKVRDEYACDLRGLWGKGYTGEGLWGRGRELDTGVLQIPEGEAVDVPESLCGGTYGRRSKKRRRNGKEKIQRSAAEIKQRRILKKFGAGGTVVGADDETKVKLEGGVLKKGKPRVAGSARGRDLRAAAALARFDTVKKEEVVIKKEESPSDSETEDDFIEGDQDGAAVDVDGTSMLDDKGRALIKICEDEDDKDGDARRELDEIEGYIARRKLKTKPPPSAKPISTPALATKPPPISNPRNKRLPPNPSTQPPSTRIHSLPETWKRRPDTKVEFTATATSAQPVSCPICSLENASASLTCIACAHVLRLDFVPDHWSCKSSACEGSEYINAGDAGVCGVCSVSKARER